MAYILETALNAYQSQKLQTELKKPTYGIIPFVKEGAGKGQIDDMTRQMIATAKSLLEAYGIEWHTTIHPYFINLYGSKLISYLKKSS